MLFNDVFKEDIDEFMDDDSLDLIGFLRYSNIVTWLCILGVRTGECCMG